MATSATDIATDHGQLVPMVTAAREQLAAAGIDERIERVLADSGYWNVAQVSEL